MSVLVTATIPADDTPFGEAMIGHPGLRIEVERSIPLDELVPYVHVTDHDAELVKQTLLSDPDIEAVETVESCPPDGPPSLYRLKWDQGIKRLITPITDNDGTLLTATGEGGEWHLTLRFPGHDGLTAWFNRYRDLGLAVQVDSIRTPSTTTDQKPMVNLTEPQRETLLTALEVGYFDIPRKTNLDELAERLGISDTAASHRLRRGMKALVGTTLTDSS